MGRFNLDDYAPVEERIGVFYEDYPDGAIRTRLERLEPPLVVFRAEVYREWMQVEPMATGYAYEKEGEGHVNTTSYIENCETSAIGRALANAGYHGRRDGAPRPSREEMQKVERMGGTPAAPVGVKHSNAKGFSLGDVAPGKKAEGKTWAELLETDNGRGFVAWAIKSMDRLDASAKKLLQNALNAAKDAPAPVQASGTDVVKLQDLINRCANADVINIEQAASAEQVLESGDAKKIAEAIQRLEVRLSNARMKQPASVGSDELAF